MHYCTIDSPEQRRIRATAQPHNRAIPAGPRGPPNSLLRLRETHYTTLLVFPALCLTLRLLSYPEKAGIPTYEEGANTPSRTRPETPASPTRAPTAVTGTLHALSSVDLTICRTLLDSAKLPSRTLLLSYEACRSAPLLSKLSTTNHSHVFIHDFNTLLRSGITQ